MIDTAARMTLYTLLQALRDVDASAESPYVRSLKGALPTTDPRRAIIRVVLTLLHLEFPSSDLIIHVIDRVCPVTAAGVFSAMISNNPHRLAIVTMFPPPINMSDTHPGSSDKSPRSSVGPVARKRKRRPILSCTGASDRGFRGFVAACVYS